MSEVLVAPQGRTTALRVGGVFAGIGGFELGLARAGFRVEWMIEENLWRRAVLRERFPGVALHSDVRFVERPWTVLGNVDIMAGGFPCQDVSQAGLKAGIEGKKSGLWKEFHRLIGECRPVYVIIENVAGLRLRGMASSPFATFSRAGTMRNGRLSPREPLVRRSGEIGSGSLAASVSIPKALCFPLAGSGLWPTPAASLPQDNVPIRTWIQNHMLSKRRHRTYAIPLPIAVHLCRSSFYSVVLTGCSASTRSGHLRRIVKSATGRLTPEFAEWLMGFPMGWTETVVSVPSGMRSSPSLPSTSGIES